MQTATNTPDPETIRTEYAALSAYHHTLVTFRFTLIGFYVTATGLIVSGTMSTDKAALLLLLSFALWLIELRTRGLLTNVLARGAQIERQHWGYRGEKAYDSFYSHLTRIKPKDDPNAGDPPPPDHTRIWNRTVEIDVHYTQAIDLIFLAITSYAVFKLF